MASLQLTFLGQVSVTIDRNTAVHFPMKSVSALLVYLMEQGPVQRHERGMLAELLWPGMAPTYGRKNLRQTLYELNKLLPELDGGPLIIATRQYLQRNPGAAVEIDTERFEQALQDPSLENLKEALAYYQGDFLADFYLPDSTAFENWAQNRRTYYRQQYREALHTLITLDPGDTASYARRLLESDPLDEDAARWLMAALAEQGERAEALKFFEQFQEQLQAEVDIEASPETQVLAASIRASKPLPATTPPTHFVLPQEASAAELLERTSAVEIRHNLPFQLTPFFGREAELAALDAFIADPGVRLVTIVGAGGMGKTRLALACVERYVTAASPFPDGVFFVDLAPLSEVEQISLALMNALEMPLQADDKRSPQQQLLDFLRQKKMLLLFDNFEHLLAGADLVRDILLDAHEMQILVTSRERLSLRVEQVYAIEGLAFSERETAALLTADVEGSAAVQLFHHAARRVQPDFDLHDSDDLTVLARICHLVGGMPLALELAAAWVELLPLTEIAAELQRELDFLAIEMRDMPERHRSVRAVMDYSWQRLDEKEQDVFAQLSVFRGGFTREAAQAVAGANLQQLARLVNTSLLQGGGHDGRYRLHALLRRYGAERLTEDREKEAAVRERHSRFYCAFLQEMEAELRSASQLAAVTKIEADYRNILAAWNEALSQGYLALLLTAVNGLGEFCDAAARWGEGVVIKEKSAGEIQAAYGETPNSVEAARLLVWLWAWRVNLSIIYVYGIKYRQFLIQHFLQPAWDLLSHPVLADLDTRAEKAFVHLLFADIFENNNQFDKRQDHLEACVNLYRSLDDDFHVTEAYLRAGYDPERSYRKKQESLALLREGGVPRQIVAKLCSLTYEARNLTAFAEAERYLEEAFAIAQKANYHQGMLETHMQAADLAWYRGQFDRALTHLKEAHVQAATLNSPLLMGACAGTMALTQLYRGQLLAAFALYQEAADLNPDGAMNDFLAMAHLHAGDYGTVESLLDKGKYFDMGDVSSLPWLRIRQADYAQAISVAQQKLEQPPVVARVEWQAWLQVPIAYALYKLDRLTEARQTLVQCLQTCLALQAFLPLMQLMPIIPVVLADGADERLKERAVELYALADSLPFVHQSQLFTDLAGKPMAAVASKLPADVAAAAQARGRALDWWPTAKALLRELKELGWEEAVGQQT